MHKDTGEPRLDLPCAYFADDAGTINRGGEDFNSRL